MHKSYFLSFSNCFYHLLKIGVYWILSELNSRSRKQTHQNKIPPPQKVKVFNLMELGRIELPSKAGISFPIAHRFSLSDPLGGNYPLSRIVGCSGMFFPN